jgi:hypothetical protein
MPSIINADNGVVSGSVGLKYSTDNTGTLALQTNGNTAMTVDSSQNILIARTSPAWANTRFSLDQTTNPAGLLSWYNGYPEVYATGNSPSTKFPYAPSGTQEVKVAQSSASTVAGYLTDFIAYNGSTATTAYMGVTAGTTYAANMVFGQRTGVQSWQETMRIDTGGRVTTPLQPSFSAWSGAGNVLFTTETPLPLNSTFWNTGSHYNTSNYRFTAPVAGKYFFRANIYKQGSSNFTRLRIQKNGNSYVYHIIPATGVQTEAIAAIVDMAVNDYVTCTYQADSGTDVYMASDHTNFSGWFLG